MLKKKKLYEYKIKNINDFYMIKKKLKMNFIYDKFS